MCIIVYQDFSISLPAPRLHPLLWSVSRARREEIYIKTVALLKTLLFKNVILAFLCSALCVCRCSKFVCVEKKKVNDSVETVELNVLVQEEGKQRRGMKYILWYNMCNSR